MPQLRSAPTFTTSNPSAALFGEDRFEWSCPACGVYGTVETADDADSASEAIKAHHTLVSPDCPNSRHVLNVIV
jgi:hypothetical protein